MNPLFVTIVAEITDFVAGKAPGSVSLFFHDWAVKLSVVRLTAFKTRHWLFFGQSFKT